MDGRPTLDEIYATLSEKRCPKCKNWIRAKDMKGGYCQPCRQLYQQEYKEHKRGSIVDPKPFSSEDVS